MSLDISILCSYFLKASTNSNLAKSGGDSDMGGSGIGGGCRLSKTLPLSGRMITVSCKRGEMWIVLVSLSMSVRNRYDHPEFKGTSVDKKLPKAVTALVLEIFTVLLVS